MPNNTPKNDFDMNDAVRLVHRQTRENVVLRCEPKYDIWLVAVVKPRSVVYVVADSLQTSYDGKDRVGQHTFKTWTEAHGHYGEVLGCGSWSEWKAEDEFIKFQGREFVAGR